MTFDECVTLTTDAATYRDPRSGRGTPTLAVDDPEAWQRIFDKAGTPISLAEARSAMKAHWAEGHKWLAPTHLIQRVMLGRSAETAGR